ncbi:hypothetical protein ACFSBZ_04655 [Amnibacterium flavum]|uniref:Uncharacterized protein n=1 Tax=Amnibacterium flavum TaxID=2173173 RepID=A0A2V1HNQ8_9MICO|nr:hypothetical protein [Amnibacterium flavum]PVZ94226.1 hypothetical protein DDQ50_10815 [Amnibacterium flavum]
MADELDDLELAILRAIVNWRIEPPETGNRHDLGMAAISKVHVEQGGGTDDWYALKQRMPHAMETLILRGYLDEDTAEATPKGRAILNR